MKRLLSLIMAVVILITFAIPAMAQSTSANVELESTIKLVKAKINVPSELTKFSYSISSYDNERYWNLTWRNEDSGASMYVTADSSGFIKNYNYYKQEENTKKLPNYSYEQGRKLAEAFINKLSSSLLKEYKILATNNNYGTQYNYNYMRQVDGVDFVEDTMSVSVSYLTGEILNYSCQYTNKMEFPDAAKAISIAAAKKTYTDKVGVKLSYLTKYVDNKKVVYLAYVPKTNSFINAITGEVETDHRWIGLYDEKAANSYGADLGGLTPEEQNAVDSVAGIMSKEEADKIIRAESLFNIDSSFVLKSNNLYKQWDSNTKFIWSLDYQYTDKDNADKSRYASVSIDAKTGEVVNFYTNYYTEKDSKPKYTVQQAKELVEKELQRLLGDKFKQSIYNENTNNIITQEIPAYISLYYVRTVNGIEFPQDFINVTFDNINGRISGLNVNWSNEYTFPSPDGVITKDKALDVLFNNVGFGLKYAVQYVYDLSNSENNKKVKLGYFVNQEIPQTIDAYTGQILDYNGSVYKPYNIKQYKDIKDSSYQDQINILAQMNIYYNEDNLNAKSNVLQKDYFMLLCKMLDIYYFSTTNVKESANDMYKMLVQQNYITQKEVSPDSVVTKEDAAKYLIKFLRLNKVAEIKGIYNIKFTDAKAINADLIGHVAIATGFKAFSTDSKGNFNPKQKVNREEALMIIYRYLQGI